MLPNSLNPDLQEPLLRWDFRCCSIFKHFKGSKSFRFACISSTRRAATALTINPICGEKNPLVQPDEKVFRSCQFRSCQLAWTFIMSIVCCLKQLDEFVAFYPSFFVAFPFPDRQKSSAKSGKKSYRSLESHNDFEDV